ncbi:hypothetical protein BBP40_004005 [Aspergillus hancockii]|nr:hypothetical protein BBP40_004005 [Aspergillus hancockii]
MDVPDLLPIIAVLSSRALRAERAQEKRNQELTTTRGVLRKTAADLEEATRLADSLYETCQRMGVVVDYLVKGWADKNSDGVESGSFEFMLSSVLQQLEGLEEHKMGPRNDDSVAQIPHREDDVTDKS